MRRTLLAFHGFTLSGAQMRRQMGGLGRRLEAEVAVMYPDAPHECSEESMKSLYAAWGVARVPPNRRWWDASADGSIYSGWLETLRYVRALMEKHEPVGLLGFSQGAILASALAALSAAGELPAIGFAIMIAGARPRAAALQPYLIRPIQVPSLHVWGEADTLMGPRPAQLAECFDSASREQAVFPGTHSIPRRGAAADRIVEFVRCQLAACSRDEAR